MPLEILSNRTKIQLTFNYFYASKNVGKILKIFHTITVNLDNVNFYLILRQKQRQPTIYEAWKTWISLSFWMFASNPHCEQAFDVTLLSGFFFGTQYFSFSFITSHSSQKMGFISMIFTSNFFSGPIFFRYRFLFSHHWSFSEPDLFFSWPKAKIVIMLRIRTPTAL